MSPQTATPLLTAEELYDIMMEVIEPDLMIKNIDTLDQKYAGESPEDRQHRFNRYSVSIQICHDAIEEFGGELESDVKELATILSKRMHADEATKLHSIEESMTQFPLSND